MYHSRKGGQDASGEDRKSGQTKKQRQPAEISILTAWMLMQGESVKIIYMDEKYFCFEYLK